MHCIVLRENLVKALSLVGRSIATKPQLPILSHILLQAGDNTLTLSATNLEIGVSTSVGAKIEKTGEVAIPGKLLTEFISTLPSSIDKITISLEGTTCTVKTPRTKASFAIGAASDFPPFPSVEPEGKMLPFEKLKDTIMRMVFAASTDDSRPVLTGIRLKTIQEGSIHMLALSATDGYRMSLENVKLAKDIEEMNIILPASSLSEIVRIAGEVKTKEVGFAIIPKKNQVVFFLETVSIFTRLIDGEFPPIERVIPQSFKTRAVFETEQLLSAVKTAALFARGAANIVKMSIAKDGVRLSANAPQVGSNEDMVEAVVEGEDVEMAFNYRFLLDVLSHFPEKQIVLESSGALNPGLFKPQGGSSTFLHVIMPVRVQN